MNLKWNNLDFEEQWEILVARGVADDIDLMSDDFDNWLDRYDNYETVLAFMPWFSNNGDDGYFNKFKCFGDFVHCSEEFACLSHFLDHLKNVMELFYAGNNNTLPMPPKF